MGWKRLQEKLQASSRKQLAVKFSTKIAKSPLIKRLDKHLNLGSFKQSGNQSLAGVAPNVNLREHVTQKPLLSANKVAHYSFETQRRHHQKSKTVVSVAPQKGLVYSKIEKMCNSLNLGKHWIYLQTIRGCPKLDR